MSWDPGARTRAWLRIVMSSPRLNQKIESLCRHVRFVPDRFLSNREVRNGQNLEQAAHFSKRSPKSVYTSAISIHSIYYALRSHAHEQAVPL